MSKVSVADVRQNVQQLLNYSLNEKKRNFLETVELQIGENPVTHLLTTCDDSAI
jgi:ribosomal protein L1